MTVATEEDGDISWGWTTIPVLEFLWGRRVDDVVGAYVSGLRPSSVNLTGGEITCDCRANRVTIYQSPGGFVTSIEQEVMVMLPENCRNGGDLRQASGLEDYLVQRYGE